jgi:hypothetical protein
MSRKFVRTTREELLMQLTLSNKAYDVGKWFAQIGLPALATLYFALAQIWALPYGSEVVGSITSVDAFLGVVLGLSTKSYNSSDTPYVGTINIASTSEGNKTYELELNGQPEDIDGKKSVTFKVNAPN